MHFGSRDSPESIHSNMTCGAMHDRPQTRAATIWVECGRGPYLDSLVSSTNWGSPSIRPNDSPYSIPRLLPAIPHLLAQRHLEPVLWLGLTVFLSRL